MESGHEKSGEMDLMRVSFQEAFGRSGHTKWEIVKRGQDLQNVKDEISNLLDHLQEDRTRFLDFLGGLQAGRAIRGDQEVGNVLAKIQEAFATLHHALTDADAMLQSKGHRGHPPSPGGE